MDAAAGKIAYVRDIISAGRDFNDVLTITLYEIFPPSRYYPDFPPRSPE